MALEITPMTFSPREAERITGISVDQQRDYRRHGYLPKVDGHARFDAYDLAKLYFVKAMADRGVGPRTSFKNAEVCATGIVHFALRYRGAFTNTLTSIVDAGIVRPVVIGPELREIFRLSIIEHGENADELTKLMTDEYFTESRVKDFLQNYITSLHRESEVPAEYFILWADGSEYWCNDLTAAFDDVAEQDHRRSGPVTVVSLRSMGFQLVKRCDAPLFFVKAD